MPRSSHSATSYFSCKPTGSPHLLQKSGVVAFAGQAVHLQKAFIGTFLDFDQVRNLDGCWNLGKIKTLSQSVIFRHSEYSQTLSAQHGAARTAESRAPWRCPGLGPWKENS